MHTFPFRAIFAAYDTILPENGLNPDHDQIYLRFLFRLGDSRTQGQSLYESFEALLEELGFQIEFVPDEDEIQDNTRIVDTSNGEYAVNTQDNHRVGPQRRSRRASFNSMYDAEPESTRAIGSRRASISGIDVSQQFVLDTRPSTRATTRKTEKTTSDPSPFKSAALQARRGRLKVEDFTNTLQQAQIKRKTAPRQGHDEGRQLTAPTTPRRNVPIHASPSMRGVRQAASAGKALFDRVSVDSHNPQPAFAVNQHERLYNPSRTQLLRDAEIFYHYRIRSVARDIVDKWCYAALQDKDQHEHMERLAAAHDTEILLRQAFEHWRVRLHARKQVAQIERYFKHQERRITRARDLMLLAKAFSHWEQCVRDERIRASNARQYILSIKYFQAWKDITLTNQHDIRLQMLRRSFGIWKHRYVQSLKENIKADLLLHRCIARNTYWRWFWAFCERRSPQWREGRLRRKYLLKWVTAFRNTRRTEQHVTTRIDDIARRRIFSRWVGKARVILEDLRRAAVFKQQKEGSHALQAMKMSTVYALLIRQASNMVDWRVAGATFTIFVMRYRFERQAAAVSRLRILRNTWTQWNDCLRWQAVAHRIDDRYCLEALYRWVIAERFLLLRRLSSERLKQRFLYKLVNECTSRQSHRERSCHLVQTSQRKALLQYCLARWHLKLDSHRHTRRMAFEFHSPKICHDALQSWTQSLAQSRKLHSWAKDAHFYFATRRVIKTWQIASVESKRQKRKNAYIQVTRQSKMNLAGGILQRWHGASSHVHDMQQEADVVYHDRLLQVGIRLYDIWKAHSELRFDQDSQASQHYQRRLLERHLYTWIERLEEQSRLEELADLTYDLRIKNLAFSWFNKLRLKIIELKGQEANAENLKTWYEKRRFRNILRQWQVQTTTKRPNPQQENKTFSSRVNRSKPRAIPPDEDPTSRAEDWTDFDIGAWIPTAVEEEADASSTPLPGYLSTPSKRAARAKALVRVSSTTPAGTPFEQRLRSQLRAMPRTPRRGGGLGRSTTTATTAVAALRGSAFGVIVEDEPRTPGSRGEG